MIYYDSDVGDISYKLLAEKANKILYPSLSDCIIILLSADLISISTYDGLNTSLSSSFIL